jgi:DNA-binding PadR family transcriptional regulator
VKGHPRKFYSLTKTGNRLLEEMTEEFERMVQIFRKLAK